MNTDLILQVFSGLFEHHAEEDAKKSRCQDTTLLHAAGDGKRVRQVPVKSDLAVLIFKQLDHYPKDLWWAAEVLQDLLETFTAHRVERFLSGRQKLQRVPCFAHDTSPGVVGGRTPFLLCLCRL